jgi:hypothetical protein
VPKTEDNMTPFQIQSDYITKTARDLHNAAVLSGWWTDMATGESTVGKRSFIEMCALIITELTEAFDGYRDGLMDDKLPHRPQFEVELADTFIRGGDTSIGCRVDLASALDYLDTGDLDAWDPFEKVQPCSMAGYLMTIVGYVSYAVEGHRKRDFAKRDINMAKAMVAIIVLADDNGCDIRGAITEKLAFNAQRPDHKMENRLKEGGKKE